MKIKILRIMHRLNVGGPTYHAAYLTKYLNNQKFETLLLTGNVDDDEKSGKYILDDLGVSPRFIPSMYRSLNLKKDYIAYKEIKEVILKFKPYIVHTHAAKSGALGRLAAINCKVPIIVHTFHGHVFHSYFGKLKTQFYLQVERYLAKRSSRIIAISQLQKKELSEIFKIDKKEKFKVIHLGFDLDRFNLDKELKRKVFRNEFNVKDDEIAIGIVGRLAPIKNHELLIRAISDILKKTTQKIRVFIIGDGEMKEILVTLVSELGMSFNVHTDTHFDKTFCFASWRKDIDIINAGLDIMTLTSFNEGTPVSLIEAQAASLPIVTTSVGGIEDVVLVNETALVSKNNDLRGFTIQLLKCIENDELRKRMSEKGYKHVLSNFSRERLVDNIEKLYIELMKVNK